MPISPDVLECLNADHPIERIAWAVSIAGQEDGTRVLIGYLANGETVRAFIPTTEMLEIYEKDLVARVQRKARHANYALDLWKEAAYYRAFGGEVR
jgi:hypothetical protein